MEQSDRPGDFCLAPVTSVWLSWHTKGGDCSAVAPSPMSYG